MSPFANRYTFREAGYVKLNDATCRSCNALIEFWRTPKGANMPVDRVDASRFLDPDSAPVITHFSTCPNAAQHKAKPAPASAAAAPAARPAKAPRPELTVASADVLQQETIWWAQRHRARAVLVLCDGDLRAWALREGEDAEQLRSDLITLANAAKRWADERAKEAA